MQRKIDAACPSCGWTATGFETDGGALKAANEHNATCQAARKAFGGDRDRPRRESA